MIAANHYAELTKAIVEISEEHKHHGRWHEATHILQLGLMMTRNAHHTPLYTAHLQTRLGGILIKQGAYGEAMALLRQAKRSAEALKDKSLLAIVYTTLGDLHYVKCFAMLVGNHYQTLDYHTQALQLYSQLEDYQQMALTISRIGIIYERIGSENMATFCYAHALQLSQTIGFKQGLAQPMARLSAYHQQRGEWCQALQYAQYTLILRSETADQEGLIFAFQQMAIVTSRLYQPLQKGLRYAQQALAIAEDLEHKSAIVQTLFIIGELYARYGRTDLAAGYFTQTAELAGQFHLEAYRRPALTKIATLSAAYEGLN